RRPRCPGSSSPGRPTTWWPPSPRDASRASARSTRGATRSSPNRSPGRRRGRVPMTGSRRRARSPSNRAVPARSLTAALVAATLSLCLASGDGASGRSRLLGLRVPRGEEEARPLGVLLHGAPAIVSFWATYCPPCQAEVPVLVRAARRWASRGVRVVGIAVDFDTPERVKAAAAAWGIDYDTYWLSADEHATAEELLPNGLPSTFFVGQAAVTRHDRLLSDEDLERLVEPLLSPAAQRPRTAAPPSNCETTASRTASARATRGKISTAPPVPTNRSVP